MHNYDTNTDTHKYSNSKFIPIPLKIQTDRFSDLKYTDITIQFLFDRSKLLWINLFG